MKKPAWFDKKINLGDCRKVKQLLNGLDLHTVCQEASCPNIGECFARNEATFLILGTQCTRRCSFCGVGKEAPQPVDPGEAERVAAAVERLGLAHVVITSVTRDDLFDGGAGHFAATVRLIRQRCQPPPVIETLIPDFKARRASLEELAAASPEIIGHNVETVPRLYAQARPFARYERSLEVLRLIKECAPGIYTKSGIMLGLGERQEEVVAVLHDLRAVGCDFLSIGQYLAPSRAHHPVMEYVRPEQFDYYKRQAQAAGFLSVGSGPYVRSSYLAAEYLRELAARR